MLRWGFQDGGGVLWPQPDLRLLHKVVGLGVGAIPPQEPEDKEMRLLPHGPPLVNQATVSPVCKPVRKDQKENCISSKEANKESRNIHAELNPQQRNTQGLIQR